jgi:hypothetical protein
VLIKELRAHAVAPLAEELPRFPRGSKDLVAAAADFALSRWSS